jgi:hypothetical protein
MSWSGFPVEGMVLALIDDTRHESFRFSPGGIVAATIGLRGGALAAPLWQWRVVQDHLVIGADPGGDVMADLHGPTLEGDLLSARAGATACSYRVSWTPPPPVRRLP